MLLNFRQSKSLQLLGFEYLFDISQLKIMFNYIDSHLLNQCKAFLRIDLHVRKFSTLTFAVIFTLMSCDQRLVKQLNFQYNTTVRLAVAD